MNKSILCNCLNPKRICNPYTHETLVVPCGHCKACALNRSMHLTLLCDLEAQTHKYCLFITLTYANRYIPRAQLVDSTVSINAYDLVSNDGEVLSGAYLSDEQKQRLLDKFYLFGSIPYLRKDDVQKFLKRFRYYAKKYTKERLRYFAVGEYGPVHFRPHYHMLLFFSDDALLQVADQIVCQSWPFGRYDCQLSKGQASSYVAGYVNSTCTIPEVFKAPAVKPFVLHSTRLGQRFLDRQLTQIYQTPVNDLIKRSCVINGKSREFDLFKSYYAYYFPKCKGFADKSSRERAYAYSVYGEARKVFPAAESAKELAVLLAEGIYRFGKNRAEYDYADDTWNRLCSYFVTFDSFPDIESRDFELWCQRIYTELLVSRHFMTRVCEHPTLSERQRKQRMIEDFYARLDYLHLREFFENQRLFFDSDFFGDEDVDTDICNSYLPYFYTNVDYDMDIYKQTVTYRLFSADVQRLFDSKIKRKFLNDRNKLFFE